MSKCPASSPSCFSVLIILSCLVAPAPASAQARIERGPYRDSLRTGDEIRVWSTTPPLRGERAVAGLVRSDSLVLEGVDRVRSPLIPHRVALAGVTRLEVNRRDIGSKATAVTGVVLGGLVGALVGGMAGAYATRGPQEFSAIRGFLVGAPIGTLIGGLTASRFIPADRWVEVAVPR